MFVEKSRTGDLENFTNHNFITKFLHNNKYILLKKLINQNFQNEFTVLDIGSGLSEFYRKFNHLYKFDYLGIEKNKKFFDICNEKLSSNKNYQIICTDVEEIINELNGRDLILCLDILEHVNFELREKIIKKISELNFKKFFINVPNEFGPAIFIKNFGSKLINYNRDFEYTVKETIYATFYKFDKLPPHTNKHKNFYWKDLFVLLEKYFKVEIKSNFYDLIPNHFSPTISFICSKK